MDVKALVDFMKEQLTRYGLCRITIVCMLLVISWRLPELISAIRWW